MDYDDETGTTIRSPKMNAALRQADVDIAARKRNKGRIQYDPHRRGELFCRIMTDQRLWQDGVLPASEADPDCDLSRRVTAYDVARDCLSLHGMSVPETNAQIIEKAVRMDNVSAFSRAYSTDSFPGIMDSIGQKALTLGCDNAGETWQYIVRQTETKNFKPYTRVVAPEFPAPQVVKENAEVPRPQLGNDAKETGQVENYGFIIEVSRPALINDDLSALTVSSFAAGRASSRAIGDAVYSLLLANAALADGYNLFSTDHGNLSATPAAPSITALNELRGLMGAQQAPSQSAANIRPQILVAAPELESTLLSLRDAADTQAHPLTPGFITAPAVLTDSRLTGTTAWFAFADPAVISSVELVRLESSTGPVLERKTIFATDGISWIVLHDFDVIATGYRGAAMNAGNG
jgi:hypothetical protein